MVSPTLESLNLKDTKEETQQQKTIDQVENAAGNKDYWSPNFWKLPSGQFPINNVNSVHLLKSADLDKYGKTLWYATGNINDDEEAIYGVFRQIQYKSQISFLAYYFFNKYRKDLYQYLKSYLNNSELNTLLTITNKKPWGLITKTGVK